MMIQVERVKVCCCILFSHIAESEKERKGDVSRVTIFAKRKRTCYLVEFISI